MLAVPYFNLCWICGKAVSLEDAGIDEFGLSVHKKCQDEWSKAKQKLTKPKAS